MLEDKILYDFSEYPTNHPNYNIINKKVLGKFKNELNSLIITEFIGLKPKMYSFDYIDNNECKYDEINVLKYDRYNNIIVNNNIHKGIKKLISLKHDECKRSLYKEELIYKEFYNLQLNKQSICLDKIKKIALNPFKSKRYWIDNINSLPYGYVE